MAEGRDAFFLKCIATLSIERFTSAFARKVYEQMMALIQSRSLELHCQNF